MPCNFLFLFFRLVCFLPRINIYFYLLHSTGMGGIFQHLTVFLYPFSYIYFLRVMMISPLCFYSKALQCNSLILYSHFSPVNISTFISRKPLVTANSYCSLFLSSIIFFFCNKTNTCNGGKVQMKHHQYI